MAENQYVQKKRKTLFITILCIVRKTARLNSSLFEKKITCITAIYYTYVVLTHASYLIKCFIDNQHADKLELCIAVFEQKDLKMV